MPKCLGKKTAVLCLYGITAGFLVGAIVSDNNGDSGQTLGLGIGTAVLFLLSVVGTFRVCRRQPEDQLRERSYSELSDWNESTRSRENSSQGTGPLSNFKYPSLA